MALISFDLLQIEHLPGNRDPSFPVLQVESISSNLLFQLTVASEASKVLKLNLWKNPLDLVQNLRSQYGCFRK